MRRSPNLQPQSFLKLPSNTTLMRSQHSLQFIVNFNWFPIWTGSGFDLNVTASLGTFPNSSFMFVSLMIRFNCFALRFCQGFVSIFALPPNLPNHIWKIDKNYINKYITYFFTYQKMWCSCIWFRNWIVSMYYWPTRSQYQRWTHRSPTSRENNTWDAPNEKSWHVIRKLE